ncbi:MAG TPA: hypothetical protein VFK43_07640, partial [Acidimicrobiales bacterium]|nr:hypothetical protein [Acidimicrobiales bacterium]
VALGAVLVLSLTTTVTNWDNTMLSESLALSFTALLAARLLAFARVPTVAHAGWVVAAATPWFFTRQNHLVLGILVVVAAGTALAVAARRRLPTVRPLAVLAGGLAAVAVLATASYRQNTEVVHFNVAMVIGNRVLLNQDAAEWFFDHGMPTLPAGIQVGVPTNPEPLLADRRFGAWVREEGTGTYLRFLAVHPWVTLTAPLDDFVSERPSFADPPHPDESMLATRESYAAARDVLPEPLGNLLYHPGQTGTVLALLLLTGVLTAFRWADGGPDPRWIVPLLLIGLQWPALTVTWHASAAELGRLALTSSIALRIGLIVQLALLADVWLADRFSGGSGSLGDPDPPENGP